MNDFDYRSGAAVVDGFSVASHVSISDAAIVLAVAPTMISAVVGNQSGAIGISHSW